MHDEDSKQLLDTMHELMRVIKGSEISRQCRASPYKFVFTLDWKSIIAIAISVIAIIDKVINTIMK